MKRVLTVRNGRAVRRHVRLPRVWARAFGKAIPKATHASRRPGLDRPESLSLSACGEKLLVSNSHGNDIAIYAFASSATTDLRLRPTLTIRDKDLLNYVHGAVYDATDRAALAVGEHSNSLSAIDLTETSKDPANPKILWSISGPANGLDNPSDIALHPDGRWLAITNRMSSGLCILEIDDEILAGAPSLALSVDIERLNALGLSATHGVAISPDGRYMFITHKPYFGAVGDTGNSAISVYRVGANCPSVESLQPIAIKDCGTSPAHHVAYHPSRDLIAVSDSRRGVEILTWDRESETLEVVGAIDIFRLGDGAKGIAFVKDGTHLAVTTELDEILFYDLDDYS